MEPLHGKAFCLMRVKKKERGRERARERGRSKHYLWGLALFTMTILVLPQQKWSGPFVNDRSTYSIHHGEFSLVPFLFVLSSVWKDTHGVRCTWPFLDFPSCLLASDQGVSVVMCNGYSFNTPLALWQRQDSVCHLWPAGLCVTFTAPSTTERTTWLRHSALWTPLSLTLFSVRAAARPVLSGPSRREQCHVRLCIFCCVCCSPWS